MKSVSLFPFSVLTLACASALAIKPLAAEPLSVEKSAAERSIERFEVRGDFRQQQINKIAGSLTVIDSAALAKQSAQQLEDLLQGTANLNYASGASRGRFLQVRGIGERSEFVDTINPSVGVLVDGIDYSSLGLSSLIDIGQLEIFRGPESTRFGAAAMAGMLNYQTRQPEQESSTTLSATLANYQSYQTELSHNAVFSEKLAARFAAQLQGSDGFIDNIHLNRNDTNNTQEQHFHTKWRYQPLQNLTVDAVLNYHKLDNGYDAFSLNRNRQTLSDQPGQDKQEIWAGSSTANYQLANGLLSVTQLTLAQADTDYGYDEDWGFIGIHPWEYSTQDRYLRDRQQWSFDQRLQSTSGQHWVLGVYAAGQDVELERQYTNNFKKRTRLFSSDLSRAQAAVYGETAWALSAATALELGLRGEQVDLDYSDSAGTVQAPDDWMWGGKIAFQHQLTDQWQAYALLSRGYKAGGVNGEALTQLSNPEFDQYHNFLRQQASFAPEQLLNREVGIKGNWLEQRYTARLAIFDMLRQHMQVNSWINQGTEFAGYISNASSGRNRGVELESNYQMTAAIRLTTNLGWLNSEIRGYQALMDVAGQQQLVDLTGRDQAHAPRRQTALGIDWQLSDTVSAQLNYQYKGGFFYSDSHSFKAKAAELINARISWQQDDLTLAVWTRNLLDKDYGVRGFYFGNDPRDEYSNKEWQQLGEPRRIGVSASYQF